MATTNQKVLQFQDTARSSAQHVMSAATSISNSAPSQSELRPILTTTIATLAICIGTLLLLCIPVLILSTIRLHSILIRPPPAAGNRKHSEFGSTSETHTRRGHLLILLGSGGHTAEMLSILRNLGREYLDTRFERRTWVVSSGDAFSMGRAREIEEEWAVEREQARVRSGMVSSATTRNEKRRAIGKGRTEKTTEEAEKQEDNNDNIEDGNDNSNDVQWNLVTVRRARRVHQSLLSTPITALGCLWDCIAVLRGTSLKNSKHGSTPQSSSNSRAQPQYPYPDLILTNGPGTGVILILASLLLLFLGLAPVATIRRGQSTTKPQTESATQNVNNDSNSNSNDRISHTKRNTNPRGSMRSIYIESWARVKSMSLSGKILKFLGARVLVQWRGLADGVDLTRIDERDGRNERNNVVVSWPRKMEFVGAVVT